MADKGSPLTPEIVSYFRLIAQSLAGVSDEEKEMLVANVHSEIDGKEYRLSVNKNCSQILETILSLSSPSYLCSFLFAVQDLIYELTLDRNGSHVLQAILKRAPPILIKENEENTIDETTGEGQNIPSLTRILINLCARLKESGWLDLIYDTFGSHVVRDIIAICGGWLTLPSKAETDKTSKNDEEETKKKHHKVEPPKIEFEHLKPFNHIIPSILAEISRQTSQDLSTMQLNTSASPLLQLLLDALSKRPTSTSELHSFISRLLLWQTEPDGSFSHGSESTAHVKALMTSQIGSHLLEKIIECASHTQIVYLYQSHFRTGFYDLCLDARANFCMQRLLQRVISTDELNEILTTLESHMKELFEKNRAGVVRWLVDACLRLKIGHMNIIKNLQTAVGITNPKTDRSFVSRFLVFGGNGKTILVMNCAILESLMSFPFELMGRTIDSFLAIDTHEIVSYACDPSSSRVLEAFMSSPTFNDHVKHKLIDRFIGSFVTLALSKFGSFVLEKLFIQANKTRRIAIAAEMGPAEERLGRAQTGRMLLTKFKIPLFKRAQHVWEEQMRANQKTSALFADITDDVEVKSTTKASPQHSPQPPPSSSETASKKRKPDEAVAAHKAVNLTNQKKKLKSLADGVDGGLPGAAAKQAPRNFEQQAPNTKAKKRKKAPKPAAPASLPKPPMTQPGVSRKDKRNARREAFRQQKALSASPAVVAAPSAPAPKKKTKPKTAKAVVK